MSEYRYENIRKLWAEERESASLGNLEDLQLSKMVEYLSKVRLKFAETHANDDIQAEIYEQEAINLEFMLRDLLLLRRSKILQAGISQEDPSGTMTISEEEFYNRITRGFSGHSDFVEKVITGEPTATVKLPDNKESVEKQTAEDNDHELEYVMVRFLKPIDDPFVGIDEATYGPYDKEDVAMIPIQNAKVWLRNGIVSRIVPDDGGE